MPVWQIQQARVDAVAQAMRAYLDDEFGSDNPRRFTRCPSPSTMQSQGWLSPQMMVDPWGTRLGMLCSAGDARSGGPGDWVVRVASAGPDQKRGTSDDIVSEPVYPQTVRG